MQRDYSKHNALKILYQKKYELDKQWDFKYPRLKNDLEAYVNVLAQIIEEAFETGQINKIKGHEMRYRKRDEKDDDEG